MKILNKDTSTYTATEEGWYSVDRGQTLFIGEDMVGYDLTRRAPVGSAAPLGRRWCGWCPGTD